METVGRRKNALRFAVGNQAGVRSSVWRLWANRDDLYLAARSHASVSKFSFHQSGINRFAINEQAHREDSSTDRALYKWSRAPEFAPGWTRCLGILVPPRITKLPFGNRIDENVEIEFIEPPTERRRLLGQLIKRKTIFNIILSHKAARPEHLIRGSAHDITIHGRVEMPRGFAWLVSFYDVFTSKERAVVVDHFNKLKIHLKPGSTGEGLRHTFLHVLEEGDPPFLVDIELGRENLDVAPG